MQKLLFLLLSLGFLASVSLQAETLVRTGKATGKIDKVIVDAAVKTTIEHRQTGSDPSAPHQPLPVTSEWSFIYDYENPDAVQITAVIMLGDHYTVTNAGNMGGTSTQTFYGFGQKFEGEAQGDADARTLTYIVNPKDRDDGLASDAIYTQASTCEPASERACKEFMKSSADMEGVSMRIQINEAKTRFSGSIIMTQYGGSGFAKSQTDVYITVEGELDPLEE